MKKINTRLQNENLIATLVIVTVFVVTALLSVWVYSRT
jgi:hypothetical protein